MGAHQKNKGDIVRFKQFDKVVSGKVESLLSGGDYTVELLEDAGILKAGTVISVAAGTVLSWPHLKGLAS